MNGIRSWFEAINAASEDWRLKLVFADWLEDCGEAGRAESWRSMGLKQRERLREKSLGACKEYVWGEYISVVSRYTWRLYEGCSLSYCKGG